MYAESTQIKNELRISFSFYLIMVAIKGINRRKVCAMLITEFKSPFIREFIYKHI